MTGNGESGWPYGSGEMAERIRTHGWGRTALGPIRQWPQSLRTAADIMLAMRGPATILWGPTHLQLYNDAYIALAKDRHPGLLGRPVAAGWPDAYEATIAPLLAKTAAGEGVLLTAFSLLLRAPGGELERRVFDTSWSPLRDETGAVAGALQTLTEVTNGHQAQLTLLAEGGRREFLLNLSDTLRPLVDPVAILSEACRLLAEHLDVDRAYYVEVDEAAGVARVERDYVRNGAPSLAGEHPVSSFSWSVDILRRGECHVIPDTQHSDLVPAADRPACAALRIIACMGAPLIKAGHLVGALCATAAHPRSWTDEEVDLLRDVGERIWAAVQRARAEVALKRSEERLATVFEALPVGVGVVDQEGTLVRQNEEMRRFLPTSIIPSRDPARADRWRAWRADGTEVPPDDYPAARALRGEHALHGLEFLFTAETGERIWTRVAAARLLGEKGEPTGAVVVVADIDVIKRSREAMRESEERLRGFGEASTDVLWIRDVETLGWTYLTPAFETIYGLPRDEALAGDNFRNWIDLIVPEDRDRALTTIRRVQAGESVTFEYRIRRPDDGTIRWLRNTDFPIRGTDGRVRSIGGVGHDASREKEADRIIRASRRQLRTLVEGMAQLVWRAAERGEWTWASPQWTAFTGQSSEASTGLGWLAVLHPDDRERAMAAWREADGTAGPLDVEYRIRQAGGETYRWFQTRAVPVRDEDTGQILEWLGTSTDIDDMRQLQEEQAVLVAELQHRTRNLIGVVGSIARSLASSSTSLDDFRLRFTERLETLSRVQGLLSRAGEARITIREVLDMELAALGAVTQGGRIALDGPDVPLRKSIVQTLALAVHELATNARKYGALADGGGGRLTVRWTTNRTEGEQRRLFLEWVEDGVDVRFENGKAITQGGGYGRQLIEKSLPYSLKARTTYELKPTGLICTIDMPLTRPRPRSSPR